MPAHGRLRYPGVAGMVLAFGIGAVVAYLLDPDRGRSRRAKLADQARARSRGLLSRLRATARYQKGVATGLAHKVTAPLRAYRSPDPETLVQKVRSEAVGQWRLDLTAPADVDVATGTSDGEIVLTGRIDDEKDHHQLLEMISNVRGVHSVDDRVSVG
jgi:osmotically-inducible protein OsmY